MYTAPLLEQSRMDIIFVFFVFSEALFLIMGVQADNQPPSDFKISDLRSVKIWDKLRIFRWFETVSNRVLFFSANGG